MKGSKFIVICCLFLCSSLDSLASKESTLASKKASHQIYFSLADQHGFPLKEQKTLFACTDKVHTVVELLNYPPGKYHLSVQWIDPNRTLREHTQYPFTVRKDFTRLWAWLTLSRGKGAGLLAFISPSSGFDDFIGEWTIRISVNHKLVSEKTIEISC